ncbi:trimeric LpxA-like protein [Bisporella sp. PMI_857]|nr:trimeric LpxA-like protein [Bisporella sp. PMI_857]
MPIGTDTHTCHPAIERMKESDVDVPWSKEYERMICGLNFKAANSQAMLDHKLMIRRRLQEFNNEHIGDDDTLETLKERRMAVARQIMGKLGPTTNIEAPLFITWGCQTFIGNGTYINRNVSIYDSAPVSIGNGALIGPGVCICTDTHEVESADRRRNGGSHAKPVRIGDYVWIGANATILPGSEYIFSRLTISHLPGS